MHTSRVLPQAPMQPPPPQPGSGGPAAPGGAFPTTDAFMTGFAGNMLRQQGQTYLQRGQAFMQSKMGFLSGGLIHYHFSITPEYGARGGGGGKGSTETLGPAEAPLCAAMPTPEQGGWWQTMADAAATRTLTASLGPRSCCPAAAVRSKLLMLVAPYLKKWSYTRVLEQISGGHK